MENNQISSEEVLHAGVAELRGRFPRTQDLYREVCILLFFRHGITPTANKLYQLVRKGSMSAPTEALNTFWSTLRERSRVTVEHADLPEELKVSAGELVAALWKSAQRTSREGLSQFQAESTAAVEEAKLREAQARAAQRVTLEELDNARSDLRVYEAMVQQLRQDLAAAAAEKSGLEARLDDMRKLQAETQAQAETARADFAAERDRLAERSQLSEQRFADMEKRALLDIDRERTATAKLQKTLESERAEHAKSIDRSRAECNTIQAEVSRLREQLGALQNATVALKDERDRAIGQLQETSTKLEATIRQAARDAARADHLGAELQRLRDTTEQQPASQAVSVSKSTTVKRRPRKATAQGS